MREAIAEQLVWYGISVTRISRRPVLALLDAGRRPHLHRAATGAVGVDDAGTAEDARPGREVGTLDELHEVVGCRLGVVDQVEDRVDDLAEVVRRDVRRHADGDALAAVDEQVREPRRQHDGLFGGAVVVRDHVDGFLVDVGQQLHGQRVQTTFGVARGGRAEVGAAVVAVEVDQRVAQRERLGHAHQGVVDRAVAVRVEAGHRVAGDTGALDVAAVGPETLFLHVPDDPAVHRLEAVAHVGQGPRHDDRHGVLEERVLHLVMEGDRLDRFGWWGDVVVSHRVSVRVRSRGAVRAQKSDVRSRGCGRRGRSW